MPSTPLTTLIDHLRAHHPRSVTGVEEARAVDPAAFAECGERFVGWAVEALGADAIPRIAGAFARFSSDVILAQARYELTGRYENSSHAECYATLYGRRETMRDYLWGVYLTNFLWAHHMELSLFFRRRFLERLAPDATIVELAPGHGGWGLWALSQLPEATLRGYDISPASVEIARSLAVAAGLAQRATYAERDALEVSEPDDAAAGAGICCFLVEHLEEPSRLLASLHDLLAPRGLAFVTGALTAAQVDHIFEFRHESELASLAERNGFRVLETLSVAPRRTLPNARFLPRSMALIVQRRSTDTW